MRQIVQLPSPKMNGVLYHYTSHATLYHIIKNKSVWAGHLSYMNDALEIKYAASQMKELIPNLSIDKGDKYGLLNQFSNWIDQYLNANFFIFSFSLSEKGNLLSQWRAYTPLETGISIGFNKAELMAHCESNQLKLVKCIYDEGEQHHLLLNIILHIKSDFENSHDELNKKTGPKGQEYYPFLNEYTDLILHEFARIKDPLFSEEDEWRILSKHYRNFTSEDIQFRPSKTSLIPYIEIKLESSAYKNLMIEQVYVGPSSNFSLSFSAISAFLSNQKVYPLIINSQQTNRQV